MLLRVSVIVLAVYGGLLYLTYFGFTKVPTGFIPSQDKGYLLVDVRLPDSLARAHASGHGPGRADRSRRRQTLRTNRNTATARCSTHGGGIPGIAHTITISGQSIVQNAIGSNYGTVYVVLDEFHHRHGSDLGADAIAAKLRAACYREVQEAQVAVFGAPAVDGLGSAGGFKVMVRDVAALGLDHASGGRRRSGRHRQSAAGTGGPVQRLPRCRRRRCIVDVDRERCKAMGVPLNEVFLTLQLYLGGYYTNDFNQFGRTWQVNLQGDPTLPLDSRTGAAAESPQLKRRNGSAGQRRSRQRDRRPGAGHSLQRRRPRPRSTAARFPASARAPSSKPSKTSPSASCRKA